MKVELPELEQLNNQLKDLEREVNALRQTVAPRRAWYTLDECCELKGVCKATINKPHYRALMPPGGCKVGRRLMYPHDAVVNWLSQTDEELLATRIIDAEKCHEHKTP